MIPLSLSSLSRSISMSRSLSVSESLFVVFFILSLSHTPLAVSFSLSLSLLGFVYVLSIPLPLCFDCISFFMFNLLPLSSVPSLPLSHNVWYLSLSPLFLSCLVPSLSLSLALCCLSPFLCFSCFVYIIALHVVYYSSLFRPALELVSGADFGCVLHHFSSPTRLDGSRGQVRPEMGLKPKIQILIFITYSKR